MGSEDGVAEPVEPEVGACVKKIISHDAFFYTVFGTIILSCILLAMDTEHALYATTDPWVLDMVHALETVCTVIFTVEAILLILGKGATACSISRAI